MFDPREDGITHINIYSKGNTTLGRFLSNFWETEINTSLGTFSSIEGFIYFLGSNNEELRTLAGPEAKLKGESSDKNIRLPEPVFKNLIKQAMLEKLQNNKYFKELLISSTLPLTHYYVYGKKVITAPKWDWQIEEWEKIRREFQNGTR